MKKSLFLFAVLLLSASCGANRSKTVAPAAPESVVSFVEGKWEQGTPQAIKLYEVRRGQLREIATSVPDAGGRFYFAFAPSKAAFYVVGTNDRAPANNYTFWISPGDRLGLTVGADSYALTGDNTPENVEITRWHDWIQPLEFKSFYFMQTHSTYEDFFPLLEEKLAEGYTPLYTANSAFNRAFDHLRESYMMTIAFNYLQTPRSVHPGQEDMVDYYRNADLSRVATSQLLDFPYGLTLPTQYAMLYMMVNRDKLSPDEMRMGGSARGAEKFILPKLRDEELAGEYMLMLAGNIKTYEGYMDFDRNYSRYFVTESQRDRFKSMLKDIPIPEASPAVDFRFPDAGGNEVALSDFKGKVVYIDVWATWCGPCRSEIPHLKKLEAEYHDNPDMVFMSVSTDADKDRGKWLDMVAAEELEGVQLFGGDRARTDISAPYKITGIPRFILIGRDGNIIRFDAPRPSSQEIRPVLDAALKK